MAYGKSLAYFLPMVALAIALAVLAVYHLAVQPSPSLIGDVGLLIVFAVGALLFLPRVLVARKGATLRVDAEGIHLAAGSGRRVDLAWNGIVSVRHGLRQIWLLKVSSIGYAIHIDGTAESLVQTIDVDDVNYKVPRAALVTLAERIAAIAQARHLRVETSASVEW